MNAALSTLKCAQLINPMKGTLNNLRTGLSQAHREGLQAGEAYPISFKDV